MYLSPFHRKKINKQLGKVRNTRRVVHSLRLPAFSLTQCLPPALPQPPGLPGPLLQSQVSVLLGRWGRCLLAHPSAPQLHLPLQPRNSGRLEAQGMGPRPYLPLCDLSEAPRICGAATCCGQPDLLLGISLYMGKPPITSKLCVSTTVRKDLSPASAQVRP